MGCQLSGSQGGGISNSASRGKGDFPFPHEDRRDVTVWRLYVFYCGVFGESHTDHPHWHRLSRLDRYRLKLLRRYLVLKPLPGFGDGGGRDA